jgi:hypothetical protein
MDYFSRVKNISVFRFSKRNSDIFWRQPVAIRPSLRWLFIGGSTMHPTASAPTFVGLIDRGCEPHFYDLRRSARSTHVPDWRRNWHKTSAS